MIWAGTPACELLYWHNTISEAECNANVAAWLASIEGAEIYLSILVLGEIRKGVERARFEELCLRPPPRELARRPREGFGAPVMRKPEKRLAASPTEEPSTEGCRLLDNRGIDLG